MSSVICPSFPGFDQFSREERQPRLLRAAVSTRPSLPLHDLIRNLFLYAFTSPMRKESREQPSDLR